MCERYFGCGCVVLFLGLHFIPFVYIYFCASIIQGYSICKSLVLCFEICYYVPTLWFLLFKIGLDIQCLLHFHINFRVSCSS